MPDETTLEVVRPRVQQIITQSLIIIVVIGSALGIGAGGLDEPPHDGTVRGIGRRNERCRQW